MLDFVEAKTSKLSKFFDKIISIEVTLRLDKDNEHGNKVAVIALNIPGDTLVAEKQSETFEESVDLCVDAVKKQLGKYKDRQ